MTKANQNFPGVKHETCPINEHGLSAGAVSKAAWVAPRLRRQSIVGLTQDMPTGVIDTTSTGST